MAISISSPESGTHRAQPSSSSLNPRLRSESQERPRIRRKCPWATNDDSASYTSSPAAWVQLLRGISRGDRLEDSPMRNSSVGYKPAVLFRKTYRKSGRRGDKEKYFLPPRFSFSLSPFLPFSLSSFTI